MRLSLFAIPLLLFSLSPTSCSEKGGESAGQVQGGRPIGKIDYVLVDRINTTVISEGERTFYESDISVKRVIDAAGDFLQKEVRLDPDFSLRISIHKENPADLGGFGLALVNEAEPYFSWNWFTVVANGKAVKLQGEGEIAFSLRSAGPLVEIDRISFISDTMLRCYKRSEVSSSGSDWISDPHWTCEIRKGSYICWALNEPN